jgi:integrase
VANGSNLNYHYFLLRLCPCSSADVLLHACRTFAVRLFGNTMARTVRNPRLNTRSPRAKLGARREPYWTVISGGCALGYRRGANGGRWIAKFRDESGRRHYEAIGAADDARDPDGLSVLAFAQAQEKARAFFARKAREAAGDAAPHDGPYTVADAVSAYLKAYERRGGKAIYATRHAAEMHILPILGMVPLTRLTAKKLEDWHHGLAEKPARARGGRGGKLNYRPSHGGSDAIRRRRATANRILTVAKAALNHAWKAGHAASDDAWRRIKPFREVETARVRYLSESECVRLVNGCEPAFRNLVRGALLTGCRYSELAALHTADFNRDAGVITVRTSKVGKPRHVVLTDEGQKLFSVLTAGVLAGEPIFKREGGGTWGKSHQLRPMLNACKRAKIKPAVSFHVLRHTYGSKLAMRGVPMGVIAQQLGHADTRMTEKHYAHLAPSYVADMIRAHFPPLGIFDESSVIPLKQKG